MPSEINTSEDLSKRFFEDCPNAKSAMKKFDIMGKIMGKLAKWDWVVLILYILLAILFSTIDIFDDYTAFALGLAAISLPLSALWTIKYISANIKTHVYAVHCSKWIKSNDLDVTNYIVERYKELLKECDVKSITGNLFDLAVSRLYAIDPNEEHKVKVHLIIRSIVGGIFLLWFAIATPLMLPSVVLFHNLHMLAAISIPLAISLLLFIVLFFVFNHRDDKRASAIYRNIAIDNND